MNLNVSWDPPASRQIEILLSTCTLGAITIKRKSNNLILVEPIILPHVSIFYENI